jgi:hypothetical protein
MKLTLKLPWEGRSLPIDPAYIPTQKAPFTNNNFTLADALTTFSQIAIYAGGFLMFFWAVWGVFDYIRAEGNKEALAKARKRIQWAIAGFIILLISFFISNLAQSTLLGRSAGSVSTPTTVTDPAIP